MRSLASSLIERGSIETTEAKAKELRPYVEKLITKAKTGTLHSRRLAGRQVHKREVADKLFADIGPMFATRQGGYTRILKTGHRKGDGAEMARIELIGANVAAAPEPKAEKPAKAGKTKAAAGSKK